MEQSKLKKKRPSGPKGSKSGFDVGNEEIDVPEIEDALDIVQEALAKGRDMKAKAKRERQRERQRQRERERARDRCTC